MNETNPSSQKPVIVKKYANRRLYNTESSSYVTLETLAEMVRKNRDFVVYDAKTGEDITRAVLTQIIVDEEGKGNALLPVNFLRQLIGVYGSEMPQMMPKYLEQAVAHFMRQQETVRETMSKTLGSFMPPAMEDMSRKNMEMMERAMAVFKPFYSPETGSKPETGEESSEGAGQEAEEEEVLNLRAEVERLQAQLAALQPPKGQSIDQGKEKKADK